MNDRIELIYEDNEYKVFVNEVEVFKDIDSENAFEKFQTEIRYSRSDESKAWDKILKKLESLNIEGLEINKQYKTLAFGDVKYFHNMERTSYIKNGTMIPLLGGYRLFKFAVTLASNGDLEKANDFFGFLRELSLKKVVYSVNETSVVVASPKFNYGSVEYNFISSKISKGAMIIDGSFKEYKDFVFSVVK
jgi:hypothetical protein